MTLMMLPCVFSKCGCAACITCSVPRKPERQMTSASCVGRLEHRRERHRLRVVDHDIDATELFDDRGDRLIDRGLVAHVAGDGQRLRAPLLDLGGRVGTGHRIPLEHRDATAFGRERQCGASPQPATGSGHNHYTIVHGSLPHELGHDLARRRDRGFLGPTRTACRPSSGWNTRRPRGSPASIRLPSATTSFGVITA